MYTPPTRIVLILYDAGLCSLAGSEGIHHQDDITQSMSHYILMHRQDRRMRPTIVQVTLYGACSQRRLKTYGMLHQIAVNWRQA